MLCACWSVRTSVSVILCNLKLENDSPKDFELGTLSRPPPKCGCTIVIGLSVRVCIRPVRNKWLCPFYSTYWCYIHQTCTDCSSWYDLLIPRGGLCPWPTFHAWVAMVRKKLLILYYITNWCYIHQSCTNCSSWHDLLIPHGGLCPWPTFHAWVTKSQNGSSGAPVMVRITIILVHISIIMFPIALYVSSKRSRPFWNLLLQGALVFNKSPSPFGFIAK